MWTHAEENPYGKSIHTREEPYIFDFIVASFIKKSSSQKLLLSNLKLTIWSQKLLVSESSLIILFCKIDVDFHQKSNIFTLAGWGF